MADNSKIEWTEASWNPVTGCTKVSPGCDHCYAETFAERFRGTPGHYFENGFDITLRPNMLDLPLRWTRPRRIFVNSMSDLFHDDIPDEYIAKVFAVMAATPQHTYQLLTKRHGRMRSLLNNDGWRSSVFQRESLLGFGRRGRRPAGLDPNRGYPAWPLPNLWAGVSVENQQWADIRIPALLDTPAAVRWLSMEPLLGPVNLARYTGETSDLPGDWDRLIDWVVVGGESGHGARPMEPAWARSLSDQCAGAGVPFFFKQWGEWAPTGQVGIGCTDPQERLVGDPDELGFRTVIRRVGKKAAGRELGGRTWDEYPKEVTHV